MRRLPCSPLPALVVAGTLALAGCGGQAAGAGATPDPAGTCPTEELRVAVTVGQWGDIGRSLAGACGDTTAIITSSTVDPHDYEPTPRDIATLTRADLVVANGAGYDAWASRALATVATPPPLVDAAEVADVPAGANPHLFFSPAAVARTADAITAELIELRPAGRAYFTARNAAFDAAMAPVDAELAQLRAASKGRAYEATESVADHLAEAAGLTNQTPQRYRDLGEEDEPTPGDIASFRQGLRSGQVDVLLYNTQTEGPVPEQLRSAAEDAGVPVVEVTETAPEQYATYPEWQLSVVRQLAAALDTP